MQHIYGIRNNLISYELHEKVVFSKHMPNWYSVYEFNIYMRSLRVLMGLWLLFYPRIIKSFFELNLDINLDDFIFFTFLNLLILFNFIFFFTLKFILRFIFI